jgi:hypothetical protein
MVTSKKLLIAEFAAILALAGFVNWALKADWWIHGVVGFIVFCGLVGGLALFLYVLGITLYRFWHFRHLFSKSGKATTAKIDRDK